MLPDPGGYSLLVAESVSRHLNQLGYEVSIGQRFNEKESIADKYFEEIKSNVNAEAAMMLFVTPKTIEFKSYIENKQSNIDLLECFEIMYYMFEVKSEKRILIGEYYNVMNTYIWLSIKLK